MSGTSSQAILTIKPSLPTGMAGGVYAIVGGALLVGCLFLFFLVTAVTGSTQVSLWICGALWILGMLLFTNKLRNNMRTAHYEFHSDRVVFRMPGKTKSMSYDRIGHVYFHNDQTFIFSEPFDGLQLPRRMRVDVPEEEGARRFREVIDLIRSNCPDHLFSYEHGKIEYSRPLTAIPGIEKRQVSRLRTVVADSVYHRDVVLDDDDQPGFTVVRPFNKKRRSPVHGLALICREAGQGPGAPSDGEVLLGLPGTDLSKNLNLEWSHSDINTGSGLLVGHFRIKRTIISPFDDFELQVLDDTLKLKGDLRDKHYELTLNGTPVGRMTSRFWSLSKLNEVEFTRPVDLQLALCLALVMSRGLLKDDDD